MWLQNVAGQAEVLNSMLESRCHNFEVQSFNRDTRFCHGLFFWKWYMVALIPERRPLLWAPLCGAMLQNKLLSIPITVNICFLRN